VARLLSAIILAAYSENIPRREVSAKRKWQLTRDRAMPRNGQRGRLGSHGAEHVGTRRPGASPVHARTYEITFLGQAGTTLRAEFDDCEVTVGPDRTTLRAELPDQGALTGLMERITGLGLDVIDVSLVAPPSG
jgi:hypothetical protein